jgi:hypothetical protein
MDAGLIQAMGSLSLADKAKARATKAYKAMTEEQKAERRAKDAERAKAKRAATKDQPKAEAPAEVAETKKEKDKLRKQKARAEAKARGAGAEEPTDLERLTLNGKVYWRDPKTQTLYLTPETYRLAPMPETWLHFTQKGLPYAIDPETMFIYSNFESEVMGVAPRSHMGVVGLLNYRTVRADTEAEQEEIDTLIEEHEHKRQEARDLRRIQLEEEEEAARPAREAERIKQEADRIKREEQEARSLRIRAEGERAERERNAMFRERREMGLEDTLLLPPALQVLSSPERVPRPRTDKLTPTHIKHLKAIAKARGDVLPLTAKGLVEKEFLTEVRDFLNSRTQDDLDEGLDYNLNAFFSHRSK